MNIFDKELESLHYSCLKYVYNIYFILEYLLTVYAVKFKINGRLWTPM